MNQGQPAPSLPMGLRWLDFLAGVLLLALTLLTLFDVAGRNLLRAPVPGATELTEIILAVFVFLTFPRLAWSGGHIVVDLLDPLVSPRGRRVQVILYGTLSTLVFAGLVWPLARLGLRALESGDATIQLSLPIGYVVIFMAIMCAATACVFFYAMLAAPQQPLIGE